MKNKYIYTALVYFVSLVPYSSNAQEVYTIKSVDASIHGTSTLHDWKSAITKIECKCSIQTNGYSLSAVNDIEVKIPVLGIKSKEGKIMDEKTYEAFQSDVNPYIIFTAASSQIKIDSVQSQVISVTGNLTMGGTTKSIVLQATGKHLANGDVMISVNKKLKMTSFNMKPPTAILGTIKVGDEVVVSVDLILTRPAVKQISSK